jgi:phosphosulfolactate synthase
MVTSTSQPHCSPRQAHGLTVMIDTGLPTRTFLDVIDSHGGWVDIVKFGWGTGLVSRDIGVKIDALRQAGIGSCFGGTLFEQSVWTGQMSGFLDLVRRHRVSHVEVSNGTIPLDQQTKARWVRHLSDEFTVLAEVGSKDPVRSERLTSAEWVDAIHADLEAGAAQVITETRESGRAGMATADGRLRPDVLDAILRECPRDRLIFEAPTKDLQVQLVRAVGPNVNLGNIAPTDLIGVATLRHGLRSDTLLDLCPMPAGALTPEPAELRRVAAA